MNVKITNTRGRKRGSERVVRRNICLPPELDRLIPTVLTKYGFGTEFSGYVQACLRKHAGLELPE